MVWVVAGTGRNVWIEWEFVGGMGGRIDGLCGDGGRKLCAASYTWLSSTGGFKCCSFLRNRVIGKFENLRIGALENLKEGERRKVWPVWGGSEVV